MSLGITTVLMLFLLLTGETSLNFTLVIFLVAVKFLSGFGIILSIVSFGIFVFQKFEEQFKGEENKKKLKAFQILLIVLPIVLIVYYGPWKISQSFIEQGAQDNIIDKLIFVYGICSLLVTLYVVPLVQGEFTTVTTVSTGEMIKSTLTKGVRGFKKRMFSWRKNFAKAQLQDQLSLRDFLDLWRQRLAVVALVVLGVGSLVFTPITVIMIGMWIRVYFLTERRPFKFEIALLVGAALALAVIAALIPFILEFTPFYATIQTNYYWVDVAYLCGLAIASVLYLHRMLRDPLAKRKERKKEEEVEDLKAEKERLEQQVKEMQAENEGTDKANKKDKGSKKKAK